MNWLVAIALLFLSVTLSGQDIPLDKLSLSALLRTESQRILNASESEFSAINVDSLTELLGHSRYLVRERAEKTLKSRGSKIASSLHAKEAHRDLEIRVRIDSILAFIEPPPKSPLEASERLAEHARQAPEVYELRQVFSELFSDDLTASATELDQWQHTLVVPRHNAHELLVYDNKQSLQELSERDFVRFSQALDAAKEGVSRLTQFWRARAEKAKFKVTVLTEARPANLRGLSTVEAMGLLGANIKLEARGKKYLLNSNDRNVHIGFAVEKELRLKVRREIAPLIFRPEVAYEGGAFKVVAQGPVSLPTLIEQYLGNFSELWEQADEVRDLRHRGDWGRWLCLPEAMD